MKTNEIPTVITFRPNEDDKERIVRLVKKQPKGRKLNMSKLLRRGLESLEKEGR